MKARIRAGESEVAEYEMIPVLPSSLKKIELNIRERHEWINASNFRGRRFVVHDWCSDNAVA